MAEICGCLTSDSVEGMLTQAVDAECDLFEARLDLLADVSEIDRLSSLAKPLVATCMPKWEGGHFKGREEDRLGLLESTFSFADYVTLEYRTDANLLESFTRKAGESGVKVISSFHDFEKTPRLEELKELADGMLEAADVAKIACKPKGFDDVLDLMSLHKHYESGSVILLSMGQVGAPSRIIAPLAGSLLTYASLGGVEAGPGQLTVSQLKEIFEALGGG